MKIRKAGSSCSSPIHVQYHSSTYTLLVCRLMVPSSMKASASSALHSHPPFISSLLPLNTHQTLKFRPQSPFISRKGARATAQISTIRRIHITAEALCVFCLHPHLHGVFREMCDREFNICLNEVSELTAKKIENKTKFYMWSCHSFQSNLPMRRVPNICTRM